MNKPKILAATLVLFIQESSASTVTRRATITGGGGNGKCTIEVNVDGAAEVEISGDTGRLRTLSGRPAVWRRFQCNAPLPRNPNEFRFNGVDGRGSAQLLRDPRGNEGTAVVHINDPKGGREGYTFDLNWRGGGGGGWLPEQPGPGPPGPWPGPGSGGFPMARAIQMCQDSVTGRLNRDGYQYINFERIIPADNPGRNDWVTGTVRAKREFRTIWFSFSCSVDFRAGRVRSVDVVRR